jgi:hypothetical protein
MATYESCSSASLFPAAHRKLLRLFKQTESHHNSKIAEFFSSILVSNCDSYHATHCVLLHTQRTWCFLTHCFLRTVLPIHHGHNGESFPVRHGVVLSGVHGSGLAGLGGMLNRERRVPA